MSLNVYVGARRNRLTILDTDDLLGFSCITIFRFIENDPKKEKISSEW